MRKIMVGAAISAGVLIGGAGVAAADHTHSLQTGNGACVLLAQNGGEKNVVLPIDQAQSFAESKRHPIHVLVHMGEPGAGGHLTIGVKGNSTNDPCFASGNYLND